jgi:hypothetical protein
MNRRLFAPAAALLFAVCSAPSLYAQATKAAPQPAAPAAPAKWVKPYKGTATIEVIQGPSRKIGTEMVTVLKIKNTSPGALALLKGDETWFDKNLKPASGDSPRPIRQPVAPGEIVELTFKAPWKADLYRSTYQFTHVHGEVKAKAVKQFSQ